ncbi:SDR family NAD(P)-dependent oxidoreductase [Sphingomonas sp. PP-CC-3G-468]|uniref:SDR family oxidoreductase n=1 Tax=Sphingomonas sp. PP-CC-3G-468 TaxID=2135656 RepID=UPI0010467F38|nr:SDR family NAD(P)-dependent oxidoreductase [Sphingomonas sp. PP-CC-3G-468]TCM07447.1 putative oxidoreductase [Sphingomonas sp. PP-CC-3G-468]
MNLKNKTALVTGGGVGIGLAITRALVDAGAHVIIAGRDLARLDRVRAELGNVSTIQVDLAVHGERERLIATLLQRDAPLDLLINNAGIMQYFSLADDHALARLDAELALDLHAPIHLSTALLPHLLSRPEAAIVNVTTGLIYAPFGNTPGYSAAKAGLHGFTRALRWQTRGTGLKVIELMPPAVDTELTRRYDGSKTDPESVARALMHGLVKGLDEVRPGQTKALYAMSRIAPGFIFRALNKAADKTPLD